MNETSPLKLKVKHTILMFSANCNDKMGKDVHMNSNHTQMVQKMAKCIFNLNQANKNGDCIF